jgi:ABC-type tungstate transport system permease subunit
VLSRRNLTAAVALVVSIFAAHLAFAQRGVDRGRFHHVDAGFRSVRIPATALQTEDQRHHQSHCTGYGQALDTGRRGDADVVFVHAKSAELKFLAEGHGVMRYPVMYNDFVLIGPKSNPAGI